MKNTTESRIAAVVKEIADQLVASAQPAQGGSRTESTLQIRIDDLKNKLTASEWDESCH